jgi:hypothetical protein
MPTTDTRTVKHLTHMAIPRESASTLLLDSQAAQHKKAVDIAARELKKVFGPLGMPDSFYDEMAVRIVTAIDREV